MQDAGYGLPITHGVGNPVNKDNKASLYYALEGQLISSILSKIVQMYYRLLLCTESTL